MSLGTTVKQFRGLYNMTQYEFADAIGVSTSTLVRIENGKTAKPTMSVLNLLARVLGLTLEKLSDLAAREETVRELNQPYIDALVKSVLKGETT